MHLASNSQSFIEMIMQNTSEYVVSNAHPIKVRVENTIHPPSLSLIPPAITSDLQTEALPSYSDHP